MKLYIYESIYTGLTNNWHSGGSAIVITDSDEPFEVLREYVGTYPEPLEFEGEPIVYEVESKEQAIFVFPDAGCC